MAEPFTILGASGFVGAHLVAHLAALGHEVRTPPRGADLSGADLGHVIDCVGMTADFRQRPFDTVDAHVCRLLPLLRDARWQSFLYLSSTRVYKYADDGREDSPISAVTQDPDDLYNLSKLMGESLVLTAGGRVARLSNVYGPDFRSANFLMSLVRDAVDTGRIVLKSDPASAKDYVAVADVVVALTAIARQGRERVYNVASGRSLTHGAILDTLAGLTGCTIETVRGAPRQVFPPITTFRLREEFGWEPASLLADLPDLVAAYRSKGPQP